MHLNRNREHGAVHSRIRPLWWEHVCMYLRFAACVCVFFFCYRYRWYKVLLLLVFGLLGIGVRVLISDIGMRYWY